MAQAIAIAIERIFVGANFTGKNPTSAAPNTGNQIKVLSIDKEKC
jgi:hypothetical protein